MRHRACTFVFLAFALVSAAPTARAAVLEEINVSGWIVGAYSDNRTGRFSHCATSVPYRSGISLFFHLSSTYAWSMGLHNPQWRNSPGQTFNLIYYIDNGPSIPVRAVVGQTGMVAIPLANSQALFESFRRGQRLHVRDARETFTFSLANSSRALAATLTCVQRYAHSAPPPPPTSNAPYPNAPSPSAQDSELRAEAAIVAANVLSASGLQGFRVLPRDQIPAEAARFDAVWIADGGLLGTVTIVAPRGGSTIEDVVASLTAQDSKDCRGAFSSGRYPTDDTGVGRLVTLCSGSSAPEVQYTVVRRRAGGFFVLGVTGKEVSSSTVLEAGSRLYDVALRTLNGR
jgi:hypothetical protein